MSISKITVVAVVMAFIIAMIDGAIWAAQDAALRNAGLATLWLILVYITTAGGGLLDTATGWLVSRGHGGPPDKIVKDAAAATAAVASAGWFGVAVGATPIAVVGAIQAGPGLYGPAAIIMAITIATIMAGLPVEARMLQTAANIMANGGNKEIAVRQAARRLLLDMTDSTITLAQPTFVIFAVTSVGVDQLPEVLAVGVAIKATANATRQIRAYLAAR